MQLDYPLSDHMVIQRKKDICLSGQAKGSKMHISLGLYQYTTPIINEYFSISICINEALGPLKMIFKSDVEIMVLEDVCVGDVFLAAGQSNIEWILKDSEDTYDKAVDFPVRLLDVPQYVYPFDQTETIWQVYNPKIALKYSALISQFIKHLHCDVPIGIILNVKGGTSARTWISEEYLKKDSIIKHIVYDDYWKGVADSLTQYKETKEYYQRFNKYQQDIKEYQINYPELSMSDIKNIVGHTPWPPPKGIYDYNAPGCLYNNMFSKVMHYPICSVIYYQGEEDCSYGPYYEQLLIMLIKNWRNCYGEDIPFYLIQLPEYSDDRFSEIRLAQREVSLKLDYVYLIVSLGTGDPHYIHPLSKEELGYRLSLYVEHYQYGHNHILCPTIKNIKYNNNEVIIIFDQVLLNIDVHLYVDGQLKVGYTQKNLIIIPCAVEDSISYACSGVPDNEIIGECRMPMSPFIILKKRLDSEKENVIMKLTSKQ